MSAVVNGNVLDLQLLLDASYSMVGECKGLTHSARMLLDLWQARHAARAPPVVVCCLVKYDQYNYTRRDLFCHIYLKYTCMIMVWRCVDCINSYILDIAHATKQTRGLTTLHINHISPQVLVKECVGELLLLTHKASVDRDSKTRSLLTVLALF
jgi:hypothetical protein